jgi:nicotinamide mononucleotide adenylyltransferase
MDSPRFQDISVSYFVVSNSSPLSLFNFIASRNIYNQDDVQEFTTFLTKKIKDKRMPQDDQKMIIKWFQRKKQGFKDYLAKNIKGNPAEFYKKVKRIHSLPVDAPDWLKERVAQEPDYFSTQEVYEVQAPLKNDPALVSKLMHIIDYFVWYLKSNPSKNLINVTWIHMLKGMAEWEKTFEVEETSEVLEGEILFLDMGSLKWYELTDEDSLKNEGSRMEHCVGDYCDEVGSGDTQIFSLRGPNNDPHATVEFSVPDKEIEQVKGKGNDLLSYRYADPLLGLLNKLKDEHGELDLSEDATIVGVYYFDGEYRSSAKEVPDKRSGKLMDIRDISSEQEAFEYAEKYPAVARVLRSPEYLREALRKNPLVLPVNITKVPIEDVLDIVDKKLGDYQYLSSRYTNDSEMIDLVLKKIETSSYEEYPMVGWVIRKLPKRIRNDLSLWPMFLEKGPPDLYRKLDPDLVIDNLGLFKKHIADKTDFYYYLCVVWEEKLDRVHRTLDNPEFLEIMTFKELDEQSTLYIVGEVTREMHRSGKFREYQIEQLNENLDSFLGKSVYTFYYEEMSKKFERDPQGFIKELFGKSYARREHTSLFVIKNVREMSPEKIFDEAFRSGIRNGDIHFFNLSLTIQDLFGAEEKEVALKALESGKGDIDLDKLSVQGKVVDEELLAHVVKRIKRGMPFNLLTTQHRVSNEFIKELLKEPRVRRSIFIDVTSIRQFQSIAFTFSSNGTPEYTKEMVIYLLDSDPDIILDDLMYANSATRSSEFLGDTKIQDKFRNTKEIFQKSSKDVLKFMILFENPEHFVIGDFKKDFINHIMDSAVTWFSGPPSDMGPAFSISSEGLTRLLGVVSEDQRIIALAKKHVLSGKFIDPLVSKLFPDSKSWIRQSLINNFSRAKLYKVKYPDLFDQDEFTEIFKEAIKKDPSAYVGASEAVIERALKDIPTLKELYAVFSGMPDYKHLNSPKEFVPMIKSFSKFKNFHLVAFNVWEYLVSVGHFETADKIRNAVPEPEKSKLDKYIKENSEQY